MVKYLTSLLNAPLSLYVYDPKGVHFMFDIIML